MGTYSIHMMPTRPINREKTMHVSCAAYSPMLVGNHTWSNSPQWTLRSSARHVVAKPVSLSIWDSKSRTVRCSKG